MQRKPQLISTFSAFWYGRSTSIELLNVKEKIERYNHYTTTNWPPLSSWFSNCVPGKPGVAWRTPTDQQILLRSSTSRMFYIKMITLKDILLLSIPITYFPYAKIRYSSCFLWVWHWSLVQREERRSKKNRKKMPRRIFLPQEVEATGHRK